MRFSVRFAVSTNHPAINDSPSTDKAHTNTMQAVSEPAPPGSLLYELMLNDGRLLQLCVATGLAALARRPASRKLDKIKQRCRAQCCEHCQHC